MTMYSYTKTPVSLDRLTQEIQQSSIVTALDHMVLFGAALDIYFKSTLSSEDETTLSSIVTAHDGTPLSENVVQNVAIQSQPSVTIMATPPYGSKTITVAGVTKKLFARNTGFQQAVSVGANTIDYVVSYPWVKLLGVEAINCEALDTVDFKVYDNAAGTYSGVPNVLLNQFAYAINLPKDFYQKMSQFDADLYIGMIIRITYTSISAKTVGINLLMNEVKS